MASEKKMTFEEALAQLERLVEAIESGEVPLEEAIAKYADGIRLIKLCRGILDRAEKKIQLLTRGDGEALKADGELDDADE